MGSGGKGGGDNGAGARQSEFERQQQDLNIKLQQQQQKFQEDLAAQQAARQAEVDKITQEKSTKEATILKETKAVADERLKQFYGPLEDTATPRYTRKAGQGPIGD
jgi:peptidoglycan hydrolase CwlO-like protein